MEAINTSETSINFYQTTQRNAPEYCQVVFVTIIWEMDWKIGFIDTSHTALGAGRNYSAITDQHTSQFTVTHTHTSVLSLLHSPLVVSR
jgi:hypothetical protein